MAPKGKKDNLSVTLTHLRDTKGTRVWGTDEDGAPISQLYIRKPQANDLPDEITVEISAA